MTYFAIIRHQEFQFSSADARFFHHHTTAGHRAIRATGKSVISKFRTGATMGTYVVCDVNIGQENCGGHKMVVYKISNGAGSAAIWHSV